MARIGEQKRGFAPMKVNNLRFLSAIWILVLTASSSAEDIHNHGAPERLGKVSFPISCGAATQPKFDRGMALLHSFAYSEARDSFQWVVKHDPKCAMAHWGIAFSYYHQLWEPPLIPASIPTAQKEIEQAQRMGTRTRREAEFISALAFIYRDVSNVPYPARASNYERAMGKIASENPDDVEAQVLYALALLATASPGYKTHRKQKQAAEILEPLNGAFPQHPGVPHYLIHAYDNAELAPRGVAAARAYSRMAPSAPHALHMPSHIFTRLGLWDDSIQANLAARQAAHEHGDKGEELHAMDYLVYAYLQKGQEADAAQILSELQKMVKLDKTDFKVAYASTAMPVRYAVERQHWTEAAGLVPSSEAPPQVVAIAVWGRGIGLARGGRPNDARKELARLTQIEQQLHVSGNDYWATQTRILADEVSAWSLQAEGSGEEARQLLRKAADAEDAIEKLPVTPGPIVPAREQLGELLLKQNSPALAIKEFAAGLANAPGRRGSLKGKKQAEEDARRQ
jgi:tetratricopeptide (TPR) repeat protein